MKNIRQITDKIFWVGACDNRLALFENLFPIPKGMAYNSYLINDTKTALVDTVDFAVSKQFFDNIDGVLNGKSLDYVIVNHIEPDHCGSLLALCEKYPEMKIVGNAKTAVLIGQFFDIDISARFVAVKENDELSLGEHTLQFIFAPMVHWPEVMVCYEKTQKILFSADAFGSFGSSNGNIFNDENDINAEWLAEARRYYSNIVGKYGMPVQSLLKKASALDIKILCPLHGLVWRGNLDTLISRYNSWSSYAPEEKAVMIAYGSIYGHTENVARVIATKLAEKGIKNIAMYDVSTTHVSQLVAETFRCSHIVIACPTYNGDIYPPMENYLRDCKALNVQNRDIAIVDNGTWAPMASKLIVKMLEEMKNMRVVDGGFSIKSSVKNNFEQIDTLVDNIFASFAQ